MGKPTLEQMDNLPDIIGAIDFRLTFSSVPGSLGIDLERISLDCTQAVIPGVTINKMEQRFSGGHKLNYGSSNTFSGTAAMQFVERVDAGTMRWMKAWSEFVRGTRTGNAGGYKKDYAVTGLLELFDGPGKVAMEISIYNMFPGEIPEISLDSASEAQPILYTTPFSYDWWEVTGVPLR